MNKKVVHYYNVDIFCNISLSPLQVKSTSQISGVTCKNCNNKLGKEFKKNKFYDKKCPKCKKTKKQYMFVEKLCYECDTKVAQKIKLINMKLHPCQNIMYKKETW